MKIFAQRHGATKKNKLRSRTEAQRHRDKEMVCEIFCPQIRRRVAADLRRLKELFFKIAWYRTENTLNLNIKNLRKILFRFNFFVCSVPLCLCANSFIFWGST